MAKLYKQKTPKGLERLHKPKSQKKNSDEFYTPRFGVEEIINFLKPECFKDKIVYCPADAEWSYFVICLKEQKDKLQYKELIYTSDDFRTHDDLFEKADFVITNPPFSLNRPFYDMLNKHNCQFCCITYPTSQQYLFKLNPNYRVLKLDLPKYNRKDMFICPEGTQNFEIFNGTLKYDIAVSDPNITYKTNDRLPYIRLFADYENPEYYDDYLYEGEKVLNINYVYDIPLDYKGYFGLPCTSFGSRYKLLPNIEIIKLIQSPKINGKNKFIRLLCKWKNFNENKQYYQKT